jgi:tetratricopeptide (TPR) repeat protein
VPFVVELLFAEPAKLASRLPTDNWYDKYRDTMNPPPPTTPARRTPLVLAALMLIAIVAFAAVTRLVTRLKANEKQIAWHAYEAGLAEIHANRPETALDDFRAALSYDRDNPTYQLSLARALRDTGRLDESEAYLLHLWNAAPQDSTINLALARLAARRQSIDDAIRYYHNAIYGVWTTEPDKNRRQGRLELIEFLLKQNAFPQAQAELIALAQILPPDPAQHLTVADLLARAGDYQTALAQYELVLKLDHSNAAAQAGAGQVAFHLGRFRTAEKYLQEAVHRQTQNTDYRAQLQMAKLVLDTDPFLRRISDAERNRRIRLAFNQAGERLKSCAQSKNIDLSNNIAANAPQPASSNALPSLWARWQAARPQLMHLKNPDNADLPDMLMDLILQIEQQTAEQCGEPTGIDLALLLSARHRETVDL